MFESNVFDVFDFSESNKNEKGNGNGNENEKQKEKKPINPNEPLLSEELESKVKPTLEEDIFLSKSLTGGCRHEIAYPEEWENKENGQEMIDDLKNLEYPKEPATTFKFTLDPFQRTSVCCIERGDSLLVSAHTSSGKTVVGEYAIAKALKNNARVIYTSPIKALSNQKYRDLKAVYGDVGLMTGDITIDPESTCLVMTTEILRNMLYKGSEIIREVQCVIFDEIHYMKNKSRGVVWEETIILLPDKVQFVFLSATIPNCLEFAKWISKIHKQACHVVFTDKRPVPLQYYLFPKGSNELYLIVDEDGNFKDRNFQKAVTSININPITNSLINNNNQSSSKNRRLQQSQDIYRVVKLIVEKNYDPIIVFAFSKKQCEVKAMELSQMSFTTSEEQEMIQFIYKQAIGTLSEDDQKLPQIKKMLPMLKSGVAVHHAGLLPIMKEIVEILFGEGFIKVLFATETFSMGLNMPAKTVIFSSTKKFDGTVFRNITSGEFIQMSGRAGRRGLDKKGIVILMLDERIEPSVAKDILLGKPDSLNSAFHLSYNMLLNLIRIEGINPEYLMSRSFFQFQCERQLPRKKQQIEELKIESNDIKIINESKIKKFYELSEKIQELSVEIQQIRTKPFYSFGYMKPGRLVRIRKIYRYGKMKFGKVKKVIKWNWGVVINIKKRHIRRKRDEMLLEDEKENEEQDNNVLEQLKNNLSSEYIVDVLIECEDLESIQKKAKNKIRKNLNKNGGNKDSNDNDDEDEEDDDNDNHRGIVKIVKFPLSDIYKISKMRVRVPENIRSVKTKNRIIRSISEVKKRLEGTIPQLDPVENYKSTERGYEQTLEKLNELKKEIKQFHLIKNTTQWKEGYKKFLSKIEILTQIEIAEKQLSEYESVILNDKLGSMKKSLESLKYVNTEGIISEKGRTACEISSGNELIITELLYQGVFNDINIYQLTSLLSCFLHKERSKTTPKLPENLNNPFRKLTETAKKVGKIEQKSGYEINIEDFVKSFHPGLMKVVERWTFGDSFLEITKLTKNFEGTIIRTLRGLEELMRQMSNAALSMGNRDLSSKINDGIVKVKRDIVFAASLYL
ncbi:exosome RNA helicase mtr4 [Anaeramoeba flamelloides]|uniref:Exosome RNA helicase mtr4 n=1 Tax=Anaeramoeba flamelloides TaxID=1746091 RepID=A0ABQ8Y2D7_9EUKA|nr:exosome RNA helicase mtr4 [Anaeramoeba flamelloides]